MIKMTPEQLKASILQYAMEGKLVKQDPNDEPASILLEKIKAEKEKLVKEGKIKKSKKLPAIEEDEKPFDIPDSWEWTRVKDVTKFGNFESIIGSDIPNGSWVVDMKDIEKNGGGFKSIVRKSIGNTYKSSKYKFSVNTVLYGKLRPYLKKVEVVNDTGFTTTEMLPIEVVSNNSLNPYFLRYVFLSPYFINMVNESMYGMKMPRVGTTFLANMALPLPPLEEQKRIVAKIEKLMPLVDKYAEAYNRLQKIDGEFKDKLKQTILQYAMEGKLVKQNPNDEPVSILLEKIKAEKEKLVKEGKIKKSKKLPAIEEDEKPFNIPDSWEWVRLENILDVRDGTHGTPKYIDFGIPLITSKNISNGYLDFSNIKYISKIDADKIDQRSKVNKGDIIFAMIGTIGNPIIVDTNKRFSIKNVALLKCFSKYLNMQYILNYLYILQNVFKENSNGAVQKFISLNKIRLSPIPLPPLAEQKRIVAKIDKMMMQIDEIQ